MIISFWSVVRIATPVWRWSRACLPRVDSKNNLVVVLKQGYALLLKLKRKVKEGENILLKLTMKGEGLGKLQVKKKIVKPVLHFYYNE